MYSSTLLTLLTSHEQVGTIINYVLISVYFKVFGPHCSTTYIDAALLPIEQHGLSVCLSLVTPAKTAAAIKMHFS